LINFLHLNFIPNYSFALLPASTRARAHTQPHTPLKVLMTRYFDTCYPLVRIWCRNIPIWRKHDLQWTLLRL